MHSQHYVHGLVALDDRTVAHRIAVGKAVQSVPELVK